MSGTSSKLTDGDPHCLRMKADESDAALREGLTAAENYLRTCDYLTEQPESGHVRLRRAEPTHPLRVNSAVRGDQ